MERSKAHRPRWLTFEPLARELAAAERRHLRAQLTALLGWQHELAAFPPLMKAPTATPFVSLYARGRLRGCFGSGEGNGAERLVRAFLRSAGDLRFGGIDAGERGCLSAQVSYPIHVQEISPEQVLERLQPATHGVALRHVGASSVVLLPHVARDEGLDAERLLQAAAQKAGLPEDAWRYAELALFETEDVAAWPKATKLPEADEPRDMAAGWLRRQLHDGNMRFGADARTGAIEERGLMHHGRVAVALRALDAWSARRLKRRVTKKAWQHITDEIRDALDKGHDIAGFPDDPAMIGGTLALAAQGHAAMTPVLARYVAQQTRELALAPWYAAQISTVLGSETPDAIWHACVRDLERSPWAPWTAIAARRRGDAAVRRRCEKALVASLRRKAPFVGGADVADPPETALTAVSIEALEGVNSSTAKAARRRGQDFLLRRQWRPDTLVAALDPMLAAGGFAPSPLSTGLRCDITGHALLALLLD